MIDPVAFAALLRDWCLEVEEDQQVLVHSTTLAEPLVSALHRGLLERGAWLALRLVPPGAQADFYTYASDRQLDGFAPIELAEGEIADANLRIDAPANTQALAGVDPARVSRALRRASRSGKLGAPAAGASPFGRHQHSLSKRG